MHLQKCPQNQIRNRSWFVQFVIQHHAASHDTKHFPKPFSQMLDVTPMNTMALDKGMLNNPQNDWR